MRSHIQVWGVAILLMPTPPTLAFNAIDRWQQTVLDGPTGSVGTPVTLTWSIVPDNTTIANVRPGVNRPSNLVASLDAWYGSGDGGALSDRPWFGLLESSFQRWEETTGVRFVYEPNDDGATHSTTFGSNGVRGDIRLAGTAIDSSSATLGTAAYAYAPDNGDIVLDTIDSSYFSNPAGDSLRLRNTLTHEIGHSLGLAHLFSSSSTILMEPEPIVNVDGPQQDDIRGIHRLYGDRFERDGGNDAPGSATPLGMLSFGQPLALGADASNSQIVNADDTDFVSIHDAMDEDYFRFSLPNRADISVSLTPVGAFYNQRFTSTGPNENINAAALGDLELELTGPDGVVTAASNPAGAPESIEYTATSGGDFTLAVRGSTNSPQLYRLEISAIDTFVAGDYGNNGLVDITDYTVWRDTLGSTTDLRADGFEDGVIDLFDYAFWVVAFNQSVTATATPEPSGLAVSTLLAAASLGLLRRV